MTTSKKHSPRYDLNDAIIKLEDLLTYLRKHSEAQKIYADRAKARYQNDSEYREKAIKKSKDRHRELKSNSNEPGMNESNN